MLYSKLGRPALGKTMRLVTQSAAEEIVQDVFTKAWQKGMVFPNLRHAYAWVYKCCTNSAIDFLRNKENTTVEMNDSATSFELSLEDKTLAKEAWTKLVKVLSPDEAAVFIYRNLEGLTQDEVVEVMQVSRRTVNRLQEKLDKKLTDLRGGRHVA